VTIVCARWVRHRPQVVCVVKDCSVFFCLYSTRDAGDSAIAARKSPAAMASPWGIPWLFVRPTHT